MQITLRPTLPISKNDDVAALHPCISIDLPNDDMSLADALAYLIMPALEAWGYGEESVKRLVKPEFDDKLEHVNCPQCGYKPVKEIITGDTIDLCHSSDIDDQDIPTASEYCRAGPIVAGGVINWDSGDVKIYHDGPRYAVRASALVTAATEG